MTGISTTVIHADRDVHPSSSVARRCGAMAPANRRVSQGRRLGRAGDVTITAGPPGSCSRSTCR